jgi:hypothetical protein
MNVDTAKTYLARAEDRIALELSRLSPYSEAKQALRAVQSELTVAMVALDEP